MLTRATQWEVDDPRLTYIHDILVSQIYDVRPDDASRFLSVKYFNLIDDLKLTQKDLFVACEINQELSDDIKAKEALIEILAKTMVERDYQIEFGKDPSLPENEDDFKKWKTVHVKTSAPGESSSSSASKIPDLTKQSKAVGSLVIQ